jgi:hypothetical protein
MVVFVVKSKQLEIGNHSQFYSIGKEVKQPGRETDKHHGHSPKTKNQPAVTALTVLIASVVTVVLSHSVSKVDVCYSSTLK